MLDCSRNKPAKKRDSDSDGAHVDLDSHKGDSAKPLTCDDDAPEPAGRLYKAGTKADQRVVDVKPQAKGVTFELVRIEMRGTD